MYLYNDTQLKPLFGDTIPWIDQDQEKEKGQNIDIEAVKREAYLQGHEEGYKKAKEEAQKEAAEMIRQMEEQHKKEMNDLLNQTIKRLGNVIDDVSGLRKEIISKADKDILEIALLVAKKVIKTEISQNKEILLNNIKEAIRNAIDRDHILIKVNPEDYNFLKGIEDLNRLLEVKEVILQKEDSISEGGCIVETKYSEIDARIESQFKYIEKNIKEQR